MKTTDYTSREWEKKILEHASCDSHGYMCEKCKNKPRKVLKIVKEQLSLARDAALEKIEKARANKFSGYDWNCGYDAGLRKAKDILNGKENMVYAQKSNSLKSK